MCCKITPSKKKRHELGKIRKEGVGRRRTGDGRRGVNMSRKGGLSCNQRIIVLEFPKKQTNEIGVV